MRASENQLRILIREILQEKNEISESLAYHTKNGVGVDKNIFRPGSTEFFRLFREARSLYYAGRYTISGEEERELLELAAAHARAGGQAGVHAGRARLWLAKQHDRRLGGPHRKQIVGNV